MELQPSKPDFTEQILEGAVALNQKIGELLYDIWSSHGDCLSPELSMRVLAALEIAGFVDSGVDDEE